MLCQLDLGLLGNGADQALQIQQSLVCIIANFVDAGLDVGRAVRVDASLNIRDLDFGGGEHVQQRGRVARRRDRFPNLVRSGANLIALGPKLLDSRLVLAAAFGHLVESLGQFSLKGVDRVLGHLAVQNVVLEESKQLRLESIHSDHQSVRAGSPVTMAGAAILLVCAITTAGNDDEFGAALAADEQSTEQILAGRGLAHARVRGRGRKTNFAFGEAGVRSDPKVLGHDAQFGSVYALPFRCRARPTNFPTCLRIAFLLCPVPDENTPVPLVVKHLPDRRRHPCPVLAVSRRLRSRNAFRVQLLRDLGKAHPVSAHPEDAYDNFRLFRIDLAPDTDDRRTSILANLSGVLDRYIAISIAPTAGDKTLEDAPFLTPVYLVGHADDVLLVNHCVQREQLARRLLARVDPLTDRDDGDSIKLEDGHCPKRVLRVPCQARRVIHQQHVERPRILLRRLQEKMQAVAPVYSRPGDRLVEADKIFGDLVILLSCSVFAALPGLILDGGGPLHVR